MHFCTIIDRGCVCDTSFFSSLSLHLILSHVRTVLGYIPFVFRGLIIFASFFFFSFYCLFKHENRKKTVRKPFFFSYRQWIQSHSYWISIRYIYGNHFWCVFYIIFFLFSSLLHCFLDFSLWIRKNHIYVLTSISTTWKIIHEFYDCMRLLTKLYSNLKETRETSNDRGV